MNLFNKKEHEAYAKSLRIDPSDMFITEVYPANINNMISDARKDMIPCDIGKISDGYHSFDELYHHRTLLFAALINTKPWNVHAWKSRQHFNPETNPMFEGMFIVGIETPYGSATYHCEDIYWDIFECEEVETAPPFDGHSPDDAIFRILKTSKEYKERNWSEVK